MKDRIPYAANVPGDFYVEDGCCTMCGVPFVAAPELFGIWHDYRGYEHCYVTRQPTDPDEMEKMIETIARADLRCIRYRGHDPAILKRLIQIGEREICDDSPERILKRLGSLIRRNWRARSNADK